MKTIILLTALITSLSPLLAQAKIKYANTQAFSVAFDGKEAARLFDALVAGGVETKAYDSFDGKRQNIAIRPLEIYTRANANIEPTDPLFKIPTYRVSFTDRMGDFSGKKEVLIDELDSATATTAKNIGRALAAVGAEKVSDCAMGGRCSESVADLSCYRNLTKNTTDCDVTFTYGLFYPEE